MRFIPKSRLKFDYLSGDGPLSLVFEASKAQQAKSKQRKLVGKFSMAALPMVCLASILMPLGQPVFVYPLMFVPALYGLFDSNRANKQFKDAVKRMFLLKNGDQVVCETYDGLMHKLNISLNTDFEVQVKKNKELVWVMSNC